MGFGKRVQTFSSSIAAKRFVISTDQTIAHTNKIVTDIDRSRDAILSVQRIVAVAERVAVFDIVVNQRRFVERFDRHRRVQNRIVPTFDDFRSVGFGCFATGHGVVNGQRNKRPRILAAG